MKYFGTLDPDFFNVTNENEKQKSIDLLVEKKLFEYTQEAHNVDYKDGVMDFMMESKYFLDPTEELLDEFYNFYMDLYKLKVQTDKFIFYDLFNRQIYGQEFSNQKSIALKHFNLIYEDIYCDVISFYDEQVSATGIKHNYSHGRFKMLFGQQSAFKHNLANAIKVNNYLTGNSEYYKEGNFIENNDIVKQIIGFEIWLQILVELNDRFNFEEDMYFTQIRIDKKNFNKYTYIFKTFQVYQFTNEKIKSINETHKACIESLYEVLIDNHLIFDHKENFMKFLKEEYDLALTKIISYDKKTNYTHDERVQLFNAEWSKLASEKN